MPVWKSGSNFDAFHALDGEKKNRILRAALLEFSRKGFKHASTNAIAENAQIGKGMLFYYFGSKQELFDFLCQYTMEFARTHYIRAVNTDSGDFLERYRALTEAKRKSMHESPEIIGFFESFYREEGEAHFEKFGKDVAEIKKTFYEKIYGGLDYSLFRRDLDGKTVVTYLKWLFDAYEADVTLRFKRGDFAIDDETALAAELSKFYAFTDDLRKVFYKGDESCGHH